MLSEAISLSICHCFVWKENCRVAESYMSTILSGYPMASRLNSIAFFTRIHKPLVVECRIRKHTFLWIVSHGHYHFCTSLQHNGWIIFKIVSSPFEMPLNLETMDAINIARNLTNFIQPSVQLLRILPKKNNNNQWTIFNLKWPARLSMRITRVQIKARTAPSVVIINVYCTV